MKNMDIFGDSSPKSTQSFEEALEDFYKDIVPSHKDFELRIRVLDPYLRNLWENGKLVRTSALDKLARLCFSRCIDEYDTQQIFLTGAAECLKYGATPEEVIELDLWESVAITRLHEFETVEEIDIHREIAIAKLIPSEASDLAKLSKTAGKNPQYFSNYGLILLKMLTKIKPCYDIIMEQVNNNPEWDAFDILNFAYLLNTDFAKTGQYNVEKALSLIQPAIGKKYTEDVFAIMLKSYGKIVDNLPCDRLSYSIILNECSAGIGSMDLLHLYGKLKEYVGSKSKELECEPEYIIAVIKSVYDAGFTAQFIKNEVAHVFIESFIHLIDGALKINQAARKTHNATNFNGKIEYYKDTISASYYFDNMREFYVLKPEIVLEELRILLAKQGFSADTDYEYLNIHWRYSQAMILQWLMSVCSTSTAMNKDTINRCIKSDFTEIQIAYNGEIIYQFPSDFFLEYEQEFTEWYYKNSPVYYTVSNVPGVNKSSQMLIISFSADRNTSVTTRTNPLAVTIGLEIKKDLIFNKSFRYDMPILKMMLCDYFETHGKDVSIVDKLDLQTVVGMIQVLILQNSKDYETLFNRPDMFLTGFQALKYCVRSDDDFNSAVLRYVINASGIYSKFFNNKFSTSLQNYVVIDNKELPILGILMKDHSLVDCLREQKGKGVISIEIKEDVVHFD